jgi:hypothetical protein
MTRDLKPTPRDYIIGLDLGQAKDYTAIAVAARYVEGADTRYEVGHLDRMRDVPYTKITEQVKHLVARPELQGRRQGYGIAHIGGGFTPGKFEGCRPDLVVDATGVGRPVVDMLRQSQLKPIAVTITGGDTVGGSGGFTVPKRDLVSTVQVLLQGGRLKVAGALPDQPLLVRELLNFQVRIDPITAHDSYGAWREGAHDDLVLAVALACWWGERARPSQFQFPSTAQYTG